MHLVFLVEEKSMMETLKVILPRVLPEEITIQYTVFSGKNDLEKRFATLLNGWPDDGSMRFVVMRDQDQDDCVALKYKLLSRIPRHQTGNTIVRIVCTELESWLLGDLEAIEMGMKHSGRVQKNLNRYIHREAFRVPDHIIDAKEQLKKITGGYYQPGRAGLIAAHMVPERNRSTSFHVFLRGVRRLCDLQ